MLAVPLICRLHYKSGNRIVEGRTLQRDMGIVVYARIAFFRVLACVKYFKIKVLWKSMRR